MAAGGSGCSDAQLTMIGGQCRVCWRRRCIGAWPSIGKGSGPSQLSSDGGSGKPQLREREATKRGSTGKSGDAVCTREGTVLSPTHGVGKNKKGVATGTQVSVLPYHPTRRLTERVSQEAVSGGSARVFREITCGRR